MKRLMTLLLSALLLLGLVACGQGEAAKDTGPHRLKVVATVFPAYDFARAAAGDRADVTLLLPPGVESHSYEPTPADILADSGLYLDIYILGLPFVFFYNVSTGIFSAMGDSKTPFYFLAVSSVANIGMDILFTTALSTVFTRGVDGVAWATFLCQGVSCILAMIFVFRRFERIETDEKPKLFSWKLLGKISVVAVPSILQQSFISVGNIIIQGVINSFGSAVIAGYSAAVKLNNLVITSLTTLGNGISNFSAQNLGAGKMDRIRSGFRAGLRLVWTLCIPFALLYFFLGKSLVYIFLDDGSGEAMQTGVMFLRIVAPFYFVVAAKLVSDGVLRGLGRMRQFMTATFTDLVLRVVLAFGLSKLWGVTGIWLSWPIGWSVATVMSIFFYRSIWKDRETHVL